MNPVSKIILITSIIVLSNGAFAQDRYKGEISLGKNSSPTMSFKIVMDGTVNTYGLGMRIKYNPEAVRVADLSGCLSGLDEKFTSALKSCKDIADQGFIQIAIADLLKDNVIPNTLGVVTFDVISKQADNGIEVTNVDAAGVKAANSNVTLVSF